MILYKNLLQRLLALPQALRFIVVGGAAAATHLLMVGMLVAATGMAPLAANVLAFLTAFAVSYHGHALLTFADARQRGWASAARFFAVACLSFGVNELLYAIALHHLHWHYFWSQAGILVLVAVGTFILSKFWAFKARHPA
ncbi:MAG: GtrA family protein [Comamonas sp.]|nr:GtrA family protein [Comamonas sp.]